MDTISRLSVALLGTLVIAAPVRAQDTENETADDQEMTAEEVMSSPEVQSAFACFSICIAPAKSDADR